MVCPLGSWVGVGIVALSLLGGCRDREPPSVSAPPVARETPVSTDRLGVDRATTLAALRMPHHRATEQLGAHVVTCRSTLTTSVPSHPTRKVEEELTLRADGAGHFAAVKHTDPQHGEEVTWTDGWLYSRLRYSVFTRRRPRSAREPAIIADRMYGLLPAYVEILSRFIAVKRVGPVRHGGREGIKVRLSLAQTPAPPPIQRAPARRWRRHVTARAIEGSAILDAKTGAPLSVKLKAGWSFHPPKAGLPASGIPRAVDRAVVGRTDLVFEQNIAEVGKKVTVDPPDTKEVKRSLRRVRLELERQMLTGERPVSGRVDEDDEDDDGE